jgi:hypothetical protein
MNRKGYGRKRSRPNLSCYSSIRLEGLAKSTRQDSQSPSRDLNLGPSGYEAEMLTPGRNVQSHGSMVNTDNSTALNECGNAMHLSGCTDEGSMQL